MKRHTAVSAKKLSGRPPVLRRPAVRKRPAASFAGRPPVLRRPAAKKRPAATSAGSLQKRGRKWQVVAETSIQGGSLVFSETAFVAKQTRRLAEEHLNQQPLFCAECCSPCGPLQANLALAAGNTSRAELLGVVRNTGSDAAALARWLDFATKTRPLPQAPDKVEKEIFVLPMPAADADIAEELCFCSQQCLTSSAAAHGALEQQHHSSKLAAEHDALLALAERAIARAVLQAGALQSKASLEAALAPVLGALGTSARGTVPKLVLADAYKRLVQGLASQMDLPAAAAKQKIQRHVPLKLYQRLVSALDARSWGLSGATMPSPLGQYCESTCSPEAPDALRTNVAEALGPVIQLLIDQEEKFDCSEAEDEEPQQDDALTIPLPTPATAQQTSPALWPKLLSDSEVELIKVFSDSFAKQEHSKGVTDGQWRTRYLHKDGAFRKSMSSILAKLSAAAVELDSRPGGWNMLAGRDASKLKPRCVEHHLVRTGGALPDPTHFDGGSLFTIDVMLADPQQDFKGGSFCTLESDGSSRSHTFGKGDALVFLSHKAHCVQPVQDGLRQTLILELWEGEERCCDHRCQQRWGVCAEESIKCRGEQSEAVPGADTIRIKMDADTVAKEAPAIFASTAFEGLAFFPKVGRMAQSECSECEPNVEVLFEQTAPIASVRALRSIRIGEPLLAAAAGDDESGTQSGDDEGEEEESLGSSDEDQS
eukprot:TRINITY_DN82448_c0_g1_i1.p1 TRINITY_DN82448_c0_g1~~TRINITY_DN82448_c0_g1_i1.p1  ORF type:complete len:711 (+),score=161.93 TRINITY_DN82448_c0_g1_i1:38-2170(+)